MSAARLVVGNDSADQLINRGGPFPFPIERKGTERSKSTEPACCRVRDNPCQESTSTEFALKSQWSRF
jgi:hypothetical protein